MNTILRSDKKLIEKRYGLSFEISDAIQSGKAVQAPLKFSFPFLKNIAHIFHFNALRDIHDNYIITHLAPVEIKNLSRSKHKYLTLGDAL